MNNSDYLKLVVDICVSSGIQARGSASVLLLPASSVEVAHRAILEDSENIIEELAEEDLLKIKKPPNFFLDVDEYLSSAERRLKIPACFYVQSLGWASYFSMQTPPQIIALRERVELFSCISKLSDYVDSINNDKKLVFLGSRKLVISSDFGAESLEENINLDWFKNEVVFTDVHKVNKVEIFKTVLMELYQDDGSVSFSKLIDDFGLVLSRLQKGYDLFVSEFSYNKVKSQIEKDKLEFTLRLNKVLSDIQNQLLAIPVAVLITGSQLTRPSVPEFTINNFVIWLGSVVFVVLIEFLLRNQRSTLQAIRNEIYLQKAMFEKHHRAIYPFFREAYVDLDDRYHRQRRLLHIIRFLVGTTLGFSSYMLLHFSFAITQGWEITISLMLGYLSIFIYWLYPYSKSKINP